jgi:hypothetical protein
MNCQFIKRHDKHELRPYLLTPSQEELNARPR